MVECGAHTTQEFLFLCVFMGRRIATTYWKVGDFVDSPSLEWLLTRALEPKLSFYLTHSWGQERWLHTFPQIICACVNITKSAGFELRSLIAFFSGPQSIAPRPHATPRVRIQTKMLKPSFKRFRGKTQIT